MSAVALLELESSESDVIGRPRCSSSNLVLLLGAAAGGVTI